ncbi:MAG TPA: trehalose-phosphatase, partial [Candidatus Eisenbacteria bacterium]|nr:trehalose-phosphatase [Candidatus Eisenbacteria bacterium]
MVREAVGSHIPPSQLAALVLGAMGPTRHLVLVLDYDGTLVPIESRPHLARADTDLAQLLDRLAAHPRVWVAVVSGRGLDDLRDVLGTTGRLSLFAEHGGLVAWPDGTVALLSGATEGEDLLRIRERLRRVSWPEGVWLEEKQLAVAVHTRGAPRPAASVARELLQQVIKEMDPGQCLQVLEGKEVLEVRPQGLHKGLV